MRQHLDVPGLPDKSQPVPPTLVGLLILDLSGLLNKNRPALPTLADLLSFDLHPLRLFALD